MKYNCQMMEKWDRYVSLCDKCCCCYDTSHHGNAAAVGKACRIGDAGRMHAELQVIAHLILLVLPEG